MIWQIQTGFLFSQYANQKVLTFTLGLTKKPVLSGFLKFAGPIENIGKLCCLRFICILYKIPY